MQVKVANIVWHHTQFHTAADFWSEVEKKLIELQSSEVQLVLFPGLTGLLHTASSLATAFSHPSSLKRVAVFKNTFEEGFSKLAYKYKLYLCPGTTITEEEGIYYISASIFNPQGERIGEQRQTHLSQTEKSWSLGRGKELKVWASPIGQLGLVIGTDIWYPEISRILALQGANLILAPAAVPTPYNAWLQVAAMWQEVQQNQFFAMENWFNGNFSSTTYQGIAPILAPCEMTPGETGYLADGQKELIACLDFTKRQKVIKNYPLLKHLNRPLYRQYLPELYERSATDGMDLPP